MSKKIDTIQGCLTRYDDGRIEYSSPAIWYIKDCSRRTKHTEPKPRMEAAVKTMDRLRKEILMR